MKKLENAHISRLGFFKYISISKTVKVRKVERFWFMKTLTEFSRTELTERLAISMSWASTQNVIVAPPAVKSGEKGL